MARRALSLALGLATLVLLAAPAAPASAGAPHVTVMTRNVYLGADLGPGVRATDLPGLVDAAGVILKEVDQNKFATRAKGLAAEIRKHNPHLVGLQEVAMWRTAPCTNSPIPPSAATVRYDYLKLLLGALNKGGKRYRTVISKPEFDFEVYVNADGDRNTSAPGCPFGSEFNGRLTMRDVILARTQGVTTSNPKSATFDTLLQVRPANVPVDVTRGWTRVDAKVPGGRKFRFVNTHLEAFDNGASNHTNQNTDVGNGEIRAAQAKELFAKGGPANSKLPVVLLGDLNSDRKTEVKPGDGLAHKALLKAKFVDRAAARPFACCLESSLLAESAGGELSDFDHNVDHVMTDTPKAIKFVRSYVTGLRPVNGFWSSDHAGLVSELVVAP